MEKDVDSGSSVEPKAEAGAGPAESRETGNAPRDRWWFSPVLYILCGTAVAGFQWEPISAGIADWLNWLVLAAGIAVLAYGIRAWYRARPR